MAAVAVRAPFVRAARPAPVRVQRPASPPYRPLHRPPHRLPLRPPLPRPLPAWASPAGVLALILLAAMLAGAAITMVLWLDDWKPLTGRSFEREPLGTAHYPGRQESQIYRSAPRASHGDADANQSDIERGIPANFPRRVKTVRFTPPTAAAGFPAAASALTGKPLRYLIGASGSGTGHDNEVTVVSYNATAPVRHGISIAYCNLFDERNTGEYAPYLKTSDTAAQYNEGQIDPRGPGWEKNLREQFERRKRQGFEYIELDNPDAYALKDVIGAIELAATYGLKVIAKNPKLVERGAVAYVAHPNVYGIIVEKGAGNPDEMDALRRKAGKSELPVWFVAFGSGRSWAGSIANAAKRYRGMGVTYSSAGEYGNAIDILPPA